MSRGKIARATIFAKLINFSSGSEKEKLGRERLRSKLNAKSEKAVEIGENPEGTKLLVDPELLFEAASLTLLKDTVNVEFYLRNDGELTIRSPLIQLDSKSNKTEDIRYLREFPQRIEMTGMSIYPGDEMQIREVLAQVEIAREADVIDGDFKVEWSVFLDNALPTRGVLSLDIDIQNVRVARRGADL